MVARFVTREDGTLLVGGMVKGQSALKPDTVYEIRDILGVLTLIERGPSCIPSNPSDRREGKRQGGGMWCEEIGLLLAVSGSQLLMTAEEYKLELKMLEEEE